MDPIAPGPQYQCAVLEVLHPHGATRSEAVVPACADGDARPCWRIAPNAEECPVTDENPQQLAIEIVRDPTVNVPSDTYVQAQCVVD